jgi:competence protein ComFB
MARRDNKTEHVMKLITRDGIAPSDSSGSDGGGIESVEAGLIRPEGNPLNYKTKLKIEIEPELAVREPVRIKQPRSRSVSVTSRESSQEHADLRDDEPPPDAPLAPFAAPPPDAPPAPFAAPPPAYEDAAVSFPDGTPYENLKESPVAAAPEAPRIGTSVYDEVRALRESDIDILRQEDRRRAKKIQIENSLMGRSRSLINLSEVLTKELLPSVMERMDVCTCPVCTGNVLALALNSLPTKYVTTDEGKQYTQLEVYKRQNELDVIAALTRACLRVKGSPRHEIIDDLEE